MQYRIGKSVIAIRLDPGDEIAASLLGVCRKEKIGCALFSGIGACRKAEIGHYDTARKKYDSKILNGMLEIVSLNGNVTSKEDGGPAIHAHISLAPSGFGVIGGHLVSAEINPTCEIIMIPIAGLEITREKDEESGLSLQKF